MASKKLVRDLFIARQPLFRQLLAPQMVSSGATRLRLTTQLNGLGSRRQFSVFNEFSKKIKGEASKSQDFQQSVKELKEKAEELKGVKEDLKARTKQTTEQLYKHVDGVWTEAEATAKKVYTNVEETISATKAEVKESFGFRKEEPSGSAGASEDIHSNGKDGGEMKFGEQKQQEQHQQSGPSDNAGAFFDKFKSGVSSVSAKASMAFQKIKEAKPIDIVKKGYDIVKDELKGNAVKRKHLEHSPQTADPSIKVENSTRTDLVVLPSKQTKWGKKWNTFMEKMRGHPLYKRVRGMSEPVVTKSQEGGMIWWDK